MARQENGLQQLVRWPGCSGFAVQDAAELQREGAVLAPTERTGDVL